MILKYPNFRNNNGDNWYHLIEGNSEMKVDSINQLNKICGVSSFFTTLNSEFKSGFEQLLSLKIIDMKKLFKQFLPIIKEKKLVTQKMVEHLFENVSQVEDWFDLFCSALGDKNICLEMFTNAALCYRKIENSKLALCLENNLNLHENFFESHLERRDLSNLFNHRGMFFKFKTKRNSEFSKVKVLLLLFFTKFCCAI